MYNTPTTTKEVVIWKEQTEQFSRDIEEHPVVEEEVEDEEGDTHTVQTRGTSAVYLYDEKYWDERDETWMKNFHRDNWEIVLNDNEKYNDLIGTHETTFNDGEGEWTDTVYSEWVDIEWINYNYSTEQELYVAELYKKGPKNWEHNENYLCYGMWNELPSNNQINVIDRQIYELNNRVDEIALSGESDDSSPKLVNASNTQFEVSTYNWDKLYINVTSENYFETGDSLGIIVKTKSINNDLYQFQFRIAFSDYDSISEEYNSFNDWWDERINDNEYPIGECNGSDVKIVFTADDVSIVCGEQNATLTKESIRSSMNNEEDATFDPIALNSDIMTIKYYSGMHSVFTLIKPYDLTTAISDLVVYDAGLPIKSYSTESTVGTLKLLETIQSLKGQIASLQSQIDDIKNGNA